MIARGGAYVVAKCRSGRKKAEKRGGERCSGEKKHEESTYPEKAHNSKAAETEKEGEKGGSGRRIGVLRFGVLQRATACTLTARGREAAAENETWGKIRFNKSINWTTLK